MGELTDLVFTLLGKLGRFMNARGRRLCFLIWILCLGYWALRNYSLGLMVQTGGCLVSILFDVYGYWNWKDKGIGK